MKATLEHILTRIPMYILVVGALSFILLFAIILSMFGEVIYTSPVSLVVSSLVFVSVSVAASYSFGVIFKTGSHLPSAVITGLILALIFTPSLEVSLLFNFALISIIAQATKFLFVYKSRHIFNPAAIGALLGGLLGLQFASWWVATPSLIIVVAVAAFLVLYKTRMLKLGGIFLGSSTVIISIVLIMDGSTTTAAIMTALTSWPLIFIAGFMLSEPLTLPSKKLHTYMVALVVAVIVALPFHISSFTSAPQFALVVGNIIAFVLAFKQRRGVSLSYEGSRDLTPTTKELVFTTPQPAFFYPGQYIEMTLPHSHADLRGIRRSFSIVTPPGSQEIRIGVKFYEPSSSFKRALRELSAGDVVSTTGIRGDFLLPNSTSEKLLFVAGGIGITPFISHILAAHNERRSITLLYFIQSPEEAAYKDILDASDVDVHYFVASSPGGLFLDGAFFTEDIAKTWVTDLRHHTAYVSGPPAMVNAVSKILHGKVQRVRTDYFSGY